MKPFIFGKKSLDIPALRLPPGLEPSLGSPRGTALRAPGSAQAHEPVVETIKEGDKVVRLIITCGCGERIEVECLYPAGN